MAKVVFEVAKGANTDRILADARKALGNLADGMRLVDDSGRRAEQRHRQLAASLDPEIRKTQELERAQRILNSSLERGIIDQTEYNRLLDLAKAKGGQQASALSSLASSYFGTAALIGAATTAGYKFLAFLSSSIEEAAEAERIQAQIEAAIRSTGGAAGFTADQLSDMADELSSATTFDDDSILKMQSVLLTFTKIKGDNFRAASEAVLDLSTRMGQDLQSAAVMVGKALQDPIRGVTSLARAGVSFSDQQKEVIKDLVDTGREAEAMQLVIAELNRQFGGSARADLDTYAGAVTNLGNAWDNLKEAIGTTVTEGEVVGDFFRRLAAGVSVITKAINDNGLLKTLLAVESAAKGNFAAMTAEIDRQAKAAGNAKVPLTAVFVSLKEMATAADLSEESMDAATEAMLRETKAADDHAKKLQQILERYVPLVKAEREYEEASKGLDEALAAHTITASQYAKAMLQVESALNRAKLASDPSLFKLEVDESAFDPLAVKGAIERFRQAFSKDIIGLEVKPEPQDVDLSAVDSEFRKTNLRFADSLAQGSTGALSYAIAEFASGSENAAENFGENLTAVLIQSVADWLAEMLLAIAKAAAEAAAVKLGTGGGGAGDAGGLSSLAGAGGTALSIGALVGVVVGVAAWAKHQDDKRRRNEFATYATGGISDGQVISDWGGRLSETGPKVMNAMADLLASLQDATGAFIVGTQEAEIRIQNDKDRFALKINDLLVGYFDSAEEAIVAAARKIFQAENLSRALDPAVQELIDNYSGGDPAAFLESIQSVQAIVDEVSGLTEIEAQLRSLPQQTASLSGELQSLGVSLGESERVAQAWNLQQLQSIRDQITGRERTAAEERAERERQAAMFNAQRALAIADVQMRREEVAAKIAILEAGGNIQTADVVSQINYLNTKADLYNQDAEIEGFHLQTLAAANNASLEMLRAQAAALDQAMSALERVAPIDFSEIRIPNRGGGGRPAASGPSREDQIAALEAELDAIANQLLPQWLARQEEVRAAYEDQIARATELGIPLDRINELYEDQMAALADDALSSLGLASVSTRNQLEELAATLAFLRDQGAITEDQIRELGNTMFLNLADWLLQWTDDEETKRSLEVLRFQMELANYRLQFQLIREMGVLTEAQIALVEGLFEDVYRAAREGDGMPDRGEGDGDDGGAQARRDRQRELRERRERAAEERRRRQEEERQRQERLLVEALDRLRSAFDEIQSVRDSFKVGELSPLTLEQQMNQAAGDYAATLARARGGDLGAIEELADAARLYAELAGQVLDPSSSAYAQLIAQLDAQLGGVQGGIQGILNAAPDEMEGTEQRLDTIAEILNQIRLLGGGSATWNPGTLPIPGGSGGISTTGGRNDGRLTGSSGNLLLGNFGTTARPMVVASPAIDAMARELRETKREIERLRGSTDRQTEQMNSLAYSTGSGSGYVGTKPSKSAMGA